MATLMDAPVTSTPSGGSRLAQMQARFQQKQMQEKEQKLLRLYESQTQRAFQRVGRGSAGSSSSSVSSTSSSLGAGKVRQLFQERRQVRYNKAGGSVPTGWDRSYPLEPLESTTTTTTTTKQRLQASKSTGNLKTARGTSLERSYSNNVAVNNHYQVKNQARRSKSQIRSNDHNNAVDLGASFRQLSLSQQKLYDEEDDDDVDYPQNHHPRVYQDEENNRIFVEREHREVELFNKHRIYNDEEEDDDIENEDPPFQQLDDDVDDFNDSSHVFQKLPNVGGRLLMENKTNNNNNNVDRYKTYTATSNGIRNTRRNVIEKEDSRKMTPPAATAAAAPPQRRREQDVAPATKPTAARTSASTRKSDTKVNTYASPTKAATSKTTSPTKPDPASQRFSSDSASSWGKRNNSENTSSQQVAQRNSPQQQMPLRTSPQQQAPIVRAPAPRGPPARRGAPGPATRGAAGPATRGAPASQDLVECRICGRNFASDRITLHQGICSKTSQKKRKVFDPTKQRVKGTEAEAFLKKGRPQQVKQIKKTNWRQKHEDFINSIRAAKEMKAHIAKGGKLSDLPPPPPSDYSDYVQCPHCSRRFNQQAAERHIPKCATYSHNKPKPQAAARGAVPKRR